MDKPKIGSYYKNNNLIFKVDDYELLENANAFRIKSSMGIIPFPIGSGGQNFKFKDDMFFLVPIGMFLSSIELDQNDFNFLINHHGHLVQQQIADKSSEIDTAFALSPYQSTARLSFAKLNNIELHDMYDHYLSLIQNGESFNEG